MDFQINLQEAPHRAGIVQQVWLLDPYATFLCLFGGLGSGANRVTRKRPQSRETSLARGRDILSKMKEEGKSCVIFYGSQWGTAEGYAKRVAKEASARFGLSSVTADLEEYGHRYLSQFLEDNLAIFTLVTQGEGDPGDNAQEFWDLVTAETPRFVEGTTPSTPLSNLRYAISGLGNENYDKYKAVAHGIDTAFQTLGAQRIEDLGLDDDAANSTEEDFLAWVESMWAGAASLLGLSGSKVEAKVSFEICEEASGYKTTGKAYLGELSEPN